MAQLTGIEWTDMSANPIRAVRKSDGKRGHACVHASPGCLHCYSERWNGWRGTGLKFNVPALDKVDIILDQKELTKMRCLKAGVKVFVCDMTDLFGPFVPDAYLDEVFSAMEANTGAIWQVLTKRPERMAVYLRQRWGDSPPAHFWAGTSVENQEWADKRTPELLKVPARIRFLSCEPLLGSVELWRFDEEDQALRGVGIVRSGGMTPSTPDSPPEGYDDSYAGIDWVICGGESGAGARLMRVDWGISLMEQCDVAGVPFFWKQMGAHLIDRHGERIRFRDGKGGDWSEWPEEMRVREFPDLVPTPDAGAVGE
jgi:protein gp37